ncbi:helix-turn-helix domain-containing protein [Nodosilinea nodulosa]|uniref:helix-turn-helix domain-containing protein n=1 Tax=Nodosilinea nodulosa TaxID=416001 RepID=UPI0004752FBE|nr:helix-turn-helix domain-containing protein [Nodosilinea nodulosa]
MTKIQLEDLQLLRMITSCSLYTLGPKPPGQIPFSISLAPPQGMVITHKQALPPQALFGFDPTREVSLITPKNFQMGILLVPLDYFERHLHDVDCHDLDTKFLQQNVIQVEDQRLENLRDYLNQIFYLAVKNPDLLVRLYPLVLGDLLPLLVNCFSAAACPRFCAHPFQRATLVQEAEAFMLAHLDEPITLKAICQAVKTSKSALSYGFQDIFGLSPMAYLKTVRLNGVRRALKASDPTQATILGIANRYGFWHMGHFSHDYRQMFGESPSETLKGAW